MIEAFLDSAEFKSLSERLYGETSTYQRQRFEALLNHFLQHFGEQPFELFSSPGRTEISGNHTDHNGGKVLTASVTVDALCAAAPTKDSRITLYSDGYEEPFIIDCNDTEYRAYEKGTAGLIRGICAGFKRGGHTIGGFNAYVSSNILFASGLSSSAAFEMLVCAILNKFFNDSKIDIVTLCKIGQFAENEYWKKPSGLLDQMGCGVGGIVSIDFANRANPTVTKVHFDFSAQMYKLLVVNTGGNHADLTSAYAEIPREMWRVARYFKKDWCAEISYSDLIANIAGIRKSCGDRAVLRAMHFFEENKRVEDQIAALESGDFDAFLNLVCQSGDSSWRLLQNCHLPSTPDSQPIPLCLALAHSFIKNKKIKGACRVHGGGFAGVVAVTLPDSAVNAFINFITPYFGANSVTVLGIRQSGAGHISDFFAR